MLGKHAARVLWLSTALSWLASATQPVVMTSLGPVAGRIFNGARAFFGIPFAEDTSGVRRFRPPVPREPWSSTRQAVDFAPGCVQTGTQTGPGADVPGNQSEDCLNINVYSPISASESSGLAVLFFLHGGGFIEGWNIGPRFVYDASMLAKKEDIVVFLPNYRLEALGFLNLPDLDLEGNNGVKDQRLALLWAIKNAQAFGGDPARITLAGQSAGAMSVGIHMASPASHGLFQRAIMQSNVGGFKYPTQKEQLNIANSFLEHAGCAALQKDKMLLCLQSLSSDQVRDGTSKAESDWRTLGRSVWEEWGQFLDLAIPWAPTVETTDLPLQIQDAFAEGKAAHVPLLHGTNRDEGLTFIGYLLGADAPDVTGLVYPIVMKYMFGDNADKVQKRYPSPGLLKSASPTIGDIVTDNWFKCATQKLALSNAKAGQATYNYRYSYRNSAAEVKAFTPALPAICVNHTCHSAEIPVIFGSGHNAVEPNSREKSLGHSMMSYWGSFIRGGTPVDVGGVEWPLFGEERQGLLLGDTVKQESEADLCHFWDSIGYPLQASKVSMSPMEDHVIHV